VSAANPVIVTLPESNPVPVLLLTEQWYPVISPEELYTRFNAPDRAIESSYIFIKGWYVEEPVCTAVRREKLIVNFVVVSVWLLYPDVTETYAS
jgi:hypothetical protein